MLSSLEIRNFRTFHHLRIERLGRVNLVVGKNNVGKTTLLEALRLYGSFWPGRTAHLILNERNEVSSSSEGERILLLPSLFHGRHPKEGDSIAIGPIGTDSGPGFQAEMCSRDDAAPSSSGEMKALGTHPVVEFRCADREYVLRPDGSLGYRIPSGGAKPPDFDPEVPCVPGAGLEEDELARYWDAISLTDSEARVLQAAELVVPLKRVAFVNDPRSNDRMAKVRVEDISDPIPLAELGDGVVRFFQIAVGLEYSDYRAKKLFEAGLLMENVHPMLLIDEVESGIHHTLHAQLWKFILRAARLLDVQVVATTHSHDCLIGFAQALADDEQADGQVVRLERSEGEEATRAVVISREKLSIVARDAIEVR